MKMRNPQTKGKCDCFLMQERSASAPSAQGRACDVWGHIARGVQVTDRVWDSPAAQREAASQGRPLTPELWEA